MASDQHYMPLPKLKRKLTLASTQSSPKRRYLMPNIIGCSKTQTTRHPQDSSEGLVDLTLDDDEVVAISPGAYRNARISLVAPDARASKLNDYTKSEDKAPGAIQAKPRTPLPDTSAPKFDKQHDRESPGQACKWPLTPKSTHVSPVGSKEKSEASALIVHRGSPKKDGSQQFTVGYEQNPDSISSMKQPADRPMNLGVSILASKKVDAQSSKASALPSKPTSSAVKDAETATQPVKSAQLYQHPSAFAKPHSDAPTPTTQTSTVKAATITPEKEPATSSLFVTDEEDIAAVNPRSTGDGPAFDAQHRERIERMLLRNERNRLSDLEESKSDERRETEHQDAVSQGSSHSPIETSSSIVSTVSNLMHPAFAAKLATPHKQAKKEEKRQHTSRKLYEIVWEDLYCVNLRVQGMSWQAVHESYCKQTNSSRARHTTEQRTRVIIRAFQSVMMDNALINNALHGDISALEGINGALRAKFGATIFFREDSTVPKNEPRKASTGSATNIPSSIPELPLLPTGVFSPSSIVESSDSKTKPHPAVSGKQPSWELLNSYYLGCYDDSDAKSDCSSDDESTVSASDDYVYFTYQVQRRECTSNQQQADGLTIEDIYWHDVGEPYTSLSRANAAACGKVLLLQIGTDPIVDGRRYGIRMDADDEGHAICEYTSDHGVVQTQVERRLRTFQDQIAARNKAEWCPRTLYHIKQRLTSKRMSDDVFEGVTTEVMESFVNGETCADLEWSNTQAVEHFVNQTYEARSANLNVRDIQVAGLKQTLKDELAAEGDKALFRAKKETAKGLVEVWVEKGRLVGPRNL